MNVGIERVTIPCLILLGAALLPVSARARQERTTQKQEKAAAESALAVSSPEQKPKFKLDPDEQAFQDASRIQDATERVDALVKIIQQYPEYPYIRNAVYYLFRDPAKSIREMQEQKPKDAKTMRRLVERFVAGTEDAPAYARAEFYSGIARNLAGRDMLLADAEALAQKAIPLLNEADYLANEKRQWERKEHYSKLRDPNARVDPYSVEEAKTHYRAFRAAAYASLGSILLKETKLDAAREAFVAAQAIEPVMEACTGLAQIAHQQGDAQAELRYMMDGYLTGKMPASKIAEMTDLYSRTHGGDTSELSAQLDRRYREHFSTPLHPKPYEDESQAPHHTVLAEFVTGAGCEPCTAVDFSFEAELQRYSRKDLALIVYHMHAPTSDPMSNASAEERFKYYDVHGAPTIFLNGEKVVPGEGTKSESQRVFDSLDQQIEERLNSPAGAKLEVSAKLDRGVVQSVVRVGSVSENDHPLRLQLALVEDEISYSGENGLRFHPMVVRNLAHADGSSVAGFTVAAGTDTSVRYEFNLKQIEADNLKYYDWYIGDLFKRVGIKASFREKRYEIDEHNLSVVAFVQDDTTKRVLDAVYVKVEPGSIRETEQAQ